MKLSTLKLSTVKVSKFNFHMVDQGGKQEVIIAKLEAKVGSTRSRG